MGDFDFLLLAVVLTLYSIFSSLTSIESDRVSSKWSQEGEEGFKAGEEVFLTQLGGGEQVLLEGAE